MLCALAVSAFAAQGASAATNGTTIFTCREPVVGDVLVGTPFNKSHCKDEDTEVGGKFRHVEVPENTTTEFTGTTENTAGEPTSSSLHAKILGVDVEITSPLAHILYENAASEKSWLTNAKDPTTGEHYFHGEATITYTEPVVNKPEGKKCKVKGGVLTTNKLKFTTKGQINHTIKFEPAAGTVIETFELEGCEIAGLNGKYELKGSVAGEADGSTLAFDRTKTTEQKTLTLRAQNAGLTGSFTITGTDKARGDSLYYPLSPTTAPTP
jgi:hypothetical protein